jgi:hypothetical protein
MAFPSSHGLVPQQDKDPQGTRSAIIVRPLNPNKKTINPNGLSGFVSAEGNFFVNIINSVWSPLSFFIYKKREGDLRQKLENKLS